MPELDNLNVVTESHPDDKTKTQQTISGLEPHKRRPEVNLEVNTETRPLAEDPLKTETIITPGGNRGQIKLTVVGPFNGEIFVPSGTTLKDALVKLNTEDDTYGRYKYRDKTDKAIGTSNTITEDTILISAHKG